MQARAFEPAGAQVQAAQIGMPEITIREVQVSAVETAQIRAAEVTGTQIMRRRAVALAVELIDPPVAQGLVERIGGLA